MTPEKTTAQGQVLTSAHHDYQEGMGSYAFFKVHNKATSQDLVQDTFMKTWRYLARGNEILLMKPFMYHILNQLIIDEYRKRKTASLDLLLYKGFDPSFDDTKNLHDRSDATSTQRMIPKLPPMYQRVMSMRFVEDLSIKEISIATGQTKNAVAVQIHRGIIKLRDIIIPDKVR
jgi:RNA polymerase sigma-70 factor (ECF subfamily)